jgi:hypothetical protein
MQRSVAMSIGRWTLVFFITYAALETVFVGLAGLALNISVRSLLLPYLILLFCALALGPPVRWALQARNQPRSCARRFALVVFFYLQLFSLVVSLSVIKLGIVSRTIILDDTAPCILAGSLITSGVVYVSTRRRLEDVGHG